MPLFRFSYIYHQEADDRAGGWTENVYSDSADFSSAQIDAVGLANKLVKVHGAESIMDAVRISQVGVKRSSLRLRAADFLEGGSTTRAEADYPTTAIEVEMIALNGMVARWWLKGVQDRCITKGGTLTKGPAANDFSALKSFIESGNFMVRGIDQSITEKDIQGVSLTGLVQSTGHALAAPDKYVRLSRFTNPRSLNKVWRATVTDADHYQLQFFTPLPEGTLVQGKPVGRVQHYTQSRVRSVNFIRATEHRVGRPIASLGGRRRKK